MLSTSVIAGGFNGQQSSGQERNRYKHQSRLSKIALQADTILTLGTEFTIAPTSHITMHKSLGASAHRLRRSHNVLDRSLMGLVHQADTCPCVAKNESRKAPKLLQMLHMLPPQASLIWRCTAH